MTAFHIHHSKLSLRFHSMKSSILNRRFLRTMTKFFLLTCIISIVFFPIYGIALEAVETGEVQKAYGDLEANAARFTSYVSRLLTQTDILLQEQSVSRTVLLGDDLHPRDYMTLIYANNFLRHSIMGDELVINAYILPKNNDIFLSGTIITEDRETLYGTFYSIDGYGKTDWEDAVFSCTGYRFLPQADTSWNFVPAQNQIRKDTVHMIIPSSSLSRLSPNCYVVYLLSVEEILDRLATPAMDDGFIYVVDREGGLVLQQNFVGTPLETQQPVTSMQIDGSDYYLMTVQDPGTGITVVAGIRSYHFVRGAMPLWNVIVLHMVVLVFISVLSSLLMAYRQDKPFQTLLDSIKNVSPIPAHPQANDYQYLSDTIFSLDNERREYEETVKSMHQSIRVHSFDRLLQQEFLSPQELSQCEKALDLPGEFFSVCIIKLGSGEDDMATTTKATALAAEYLGEGCRLSFRFYNPEALKIVLIISLPPEMPCTLSPLRGYLEGLVDLLYENQVWAVMGLGVISYGLSSLYASADCAMSALRIANYDAPVQFVSNLVHHSKSLPYDHITAQRLYDLLIVGDSACVQDFFRSLAAQVQQNPPASKTDICQIFYGLYNTVSNAAQQLIGDPHDLDRPSFSEDMGILEVLDRFQTVCLQLCRQILHQQQRDQEKRTWDIIRYIQQNYADSGLCAYTIAEHFSVSEKYVFALVKNQTGKTLGDFIEEERFRQVEALLSSGVSINAIPELVGFNSVNTFYKAFKRNYGVSPGKWRNSIRQAAGPGKEP